MTCTIAYLQRKHNGVVNGWMAADSFASNWRSGFTCSNNKVFRAKGCDEILVGMAGSFNNQLIRYAEIVDQTKYLRRELSEEYFIMGMPLYLKELKKVYLGEDDYFSFLMTFQDKIFEVQSDNSVIVHAGDYATIGSGDQIALGALMGIEMTDPDMSVEKRLFMALNASQHAVPSVREPFLAINSEEPVVLYVYSQNEITKINQATGEVETYPLFDEEVLLTGVELEQAIELMKQNEKQEDEKQEDEKQNSGGEKDESNTTVELLAE